MSKVRGKPKSSSSEYRTWAAAKQRCNNPNDQGYRNYGGRGITMCDRWANSFDSFLEDMGERPPGKTLERIDNDGNYEPDNCCWATRKEQQKNRRPWENPGSRRAAARRHGLAESTIRKRLKHGWTLEEALNTPPKAKRN